MITSPLTLAAIDKNTGAREELLRLMEVHTEDLLAASPDEVLSEAREGAVDLVAQKARVMELFRRSEGRVGRARMAAARAALAAHRQNPTSVGKLSAAVVADQTQALTLAARNGTSQSERDKETLQSDLDELANFDPGRCSEVIKVTPAEKMLQSLGVTCPEDIDLNAIAWELGVIDVKLRELDGCEARIAGLGDRAIVSLDPRPMRRRRRFSLAHELGHWVHHRGETTFCRAEDIGEGGNHNGFEQSANAFAADLILPTYLVSPIARTCSRLTVRFVKNIAGRFDATKSAATLRLVALGEYPALAISYVIPGRRKWFKRSPLVPERWFPQEELHHQTYAFDLLHGRSTEQGNHRRIGADAFFDRREAQRYEVNHSRPGLLKSLPSRRLRPTVCWKDISEPFRLLPRQQG
jgi:hypothetical protein